jgi:hypothetical protein
MRLSWDESGWPSYDLGISLGALTVADSAKSHVIANPETISEFKGITHILDMWKFLGNSAALILVAARAALSWHPWGSLSHLRNP